MELFEIGTTRTHEVRAEHGEWTINATVFMRGDKTTNIDGNAQKPNVAMVNFNAFNNGNTLTRNISGVTDASEDVYAVISAFLDAVVVKYEGE